MPSEDSTMKFRADIQQLKAAMQQASRAIRVANSEFKASTAGLDKWNQSAVGLQAKLKQLTTVIDAQKKQLSLAEAELERVKKVYGENSAEADRATIAVNKYKAEIAKSEKDLDKYENELKEVESQQEKTNDAVEESSDAAKKASDGFTVLKGALSQLVADGFRMAIRAAKDFAKETFEAGANFEAAMSQVEAISGANANEMEQLTAKAKEMGEVTKFSATESAQAFNYMAMAGWETEDMLNGIEGIMNLAAASGEDLATTSDIVTDALTAMGYSAGDAGQLADVMAAASANANTNVGLMGSTFQYAAPLAGALGYSMEDVAVAIGLMANAGVKGSKAGTALRSVFTRLADPPKAAAGALSELGIELTDAEGKMKPFSRVMQELRKGFSGLDEVQKTQMASSIAGKNAVAGFLAIVNGADDDFNKLTTAVANSAGASQSMADTMNDNVTGQIVLLRSKIEGVMIKIFEKIAPAVRKAIDNIDDAIDDLDMDSISNDIGEIAGAIGDLFAYILRNGGSILDFLKVLGITVGTAFATKKLISFTQGVSGGIDILKKYAESTTFAAKATGLLNTAQMALPWVAVGVGALAVVGAYSAYINATEEAARAEYRLNDEQQKTVDTISENRKTIEELTEARKEAVASAVGEYDYIEQLKAEYNDLIDSNGKVKAGYEDRANFILTTLSNALGLERSQLEALIDKNGELGASIDDLILKQRAQAALNASEEEYNNAIKNRGNALTELGAAMRTVEETEAAYAESNAKASAIMDEYNRLLLDAPDAAYAYRAANANVLAANDEAKASFDKAKQAVADAEQNYIDYNTAILNYEGLSSAAISGDVDKIDDALSRLNAGFVTSADGTREILQQQVQDAEDKYYALQAAAKTGYSKVSDTEIKEAKKMMDLSRAELAKLPPEGEKAGKEAGTKFASGIGNASSEAKNKAEGVAKQAKKGLDSGTDTKQSGENFGQGFINGIGSMMDSAYNKAYSLAQKATSGLKKGQKEGSPSKITYQSGVYFVQGYMNGIASMEKGLVNTVKSMVTVAISELGKARNYNFLEVGNNASSAITSAITSEMSYTIDKMTYQNQQKLAKFDSDIKALEKKRDAETTKLQKASDKKIASLQSKANKTKNNKTKAALRKQIAAEKKDAKKQIAATKANYEKQIEAQKNLKSDYQTASAKMISEFQSAMNQYQQKAEALIDDVIGGITEKYDARYNELIGKQDNLISKLKSAGDLFDISNAGVMTVNDIKAQTKAINDYAAKLQQIKAKVSADLFDEIVSFDMTEGSAFIDRLLSMSVEDLNAYSKAYEEKMAAASKAGESIYKADFDKVSKDYQSELNTAFKGLDKQLEELGNQAMKGFVNGLTKNTDYMESGIKTYIKAMIDTFKNELKIKSPSKVMFNLGEYTGEGFDDGLMSMLSKIKKTAGMIADSASSPLNYQSAAINGVKGSIQASAGVGGVNNSNVTNNYNLVQNNTSPKALSAIETYQARRRQLALVKAVMGNN